MKEKTRGIKINGKRIHSIRFADDIALIADTEKELNRMLEILNKLLEKFKLKINTKKTKIMVIDKQKHSVNANIRIGQTRLEQVKQYCYLGSMIEEGNRSLTEIKRRIAMAKQAFQNKKSVFVNSHISMQTRKKFLKTLVWSVLTYGCETWTLGKQERTKLEAAEMWFWRRMTKTSWTERKSNVIILHEINENRELLKVIAKRKIKLLGHVLRHNNFLQNIFEGKVLGKKTRGRPRMAFLKNTIHEMGCNSYAGMKELARNRELWLQRQGIAFR